MENKEQLSGIERDLVLQYLMDGNVPVTLTPVENNVTPDESIHSVPSQIFPVAIKGDSIKVHKNGKIYLENPNQSVIGFANKTVKVEFYFNRVGVFFISLVKEEKKSLVLTLPETISRIKDEEEKDEYDFSAQLFFECKNKKDINERCIPWEHEQLFNRPVWKSIPLENQKLAKDYLEKFVEEAKIEKNAGNGIQLIPVCNYLTLNEEKMEAVQNRKKPYYILYVDHERIVLGYDGETEYIKGDEYGLKMSFSIKESPVASRDIFVTCAVNKIYQTEKNNNKACLDLVYTTVQEEDIRFLYEKATKKHFI